MSSMYENAAQTELSDSYETDVWTESPSKFKEKGEVKEEDEERDRLSLNRVESCMNGPVLDLFECVFTLRSKPMMRRALVSLVRQTIEFFFSIERSISQRHSRLSECAVHGDGASSWLLRVVWPEVPYPPDTPKRLAREAETARRALFDVFTNQNVQTVMGTAPAPARRTTPSPDSESNLLSTRRLRPHRDHRLGSVPRNHRSRPSPRPG